ncbi:MAG: hypothetical protein ACT4O5_08690 [Gammaproteobacteria bacterium]
MNTLDDLETMFGAKSIPMTCVIKAMRDAWRAVDPIRPPGQPGSYARGRHNGWCDALQQLRANLALELRQVEPVLPEGWVATARVGEFVKCQRELEARFLHKHPDRYADCDWTGIQIKCRECGKTDIDNVML